MLSGNGRYITSTEMSETQSLDDRIPEMNSVDSSSPDEQWSIVNSRENLKKKICKKGNGQNTKPKPGNLVNITYKLFLLDGKEVVENKCVDVIYQDSDIIKGLDLAIGDMEEGESAELKIPADLAYGIHGMPPKIPLNSDLSCYVEVHKVSIACDEHTLPFKERLKIGALDFLDTNDMGRFRYTRAPMGLNASGDEWCYRSDLALEGLEGTKLVDDVVIEADTLEILYYRLRNVLKHCGENNIQLNAENFRAFNPTSNGLAGAAVKNAKSLVLKCKETSEDFEQARSEFRLMSCADGYSPADIMFGRKPRGILPSIQTSVDREAGQEACQEDLEKSRHRHSSRPCLPLLSVRNKVLLQDLKSAKW
ncbi:Peptidyl-prolyl cis-trans isomerase FKBP62 [Nymphon striatum]|nr:Peptidyl-prolyl cis-trans isomerase FKBP62 [Nymphon striatum]